MATIGTLLGVVSPSETIYDGQAIGMWIGQIASSGYVTQVDFVTDSGGGNGQFAWAIYKTSTNLGPPTTLLANGIDTISGSSQHTHTIAGLNIAVNNGDQIYFALMSIDSDNRISLYSSSSSGTTQGFDGTDTFNVYEDYNLTYPTFGNPFGQEDHLLENIPAVQITYSSTIPATISNGTPTGTSGATSATLGLTTNQATGTAYWILDTASNISGITSAQIKAGNNKNGTSAFKSANATVSTTTVNASVTGLSTGTTYSVAAVQNNANGDSNVITWTFTTGTVTTSTSLKLMSDATTPAANLSIAWFLTSSWGSNPIISGTNSTDASGNLLLTSLSPAAGNYKLFYKLASDENVMGVRSVVLV